MLYWHSLHYLGCCLPFGGTRGFQVAQTGWGKLHNLSKITGFFASLGCRLLAVDSAIAKRLKPLDTMMESQASNRTEGEMIAGILAG